MYDAFQNYAALGGYPGMNPQSGWPAMQPSAINPLTPFHPLASLLAASAMGHGIPQSGLPVQGNQFPIGQQQSLPQFFGQSPWAIGQNPLQAALAANPLLAASLQNPLIAAALSNPFVNYAGQNPFLGQLGLQHSPYPQTTQFGPQLGQGQPGIYGSGIYGQGYPLAPQTWVGQAGPFGSGQPFGQIHPLQAQFGARPY